MLDVFDALLTDILPVRVHQLVIERRSGAVATFHSGAARLMFSAALIDSDGALLAAVEGEVTVLPTEALEPQRTARSRAFLEGWRRALPAYAALRGLDRLEPHALTQGTLHELAPPISLLDDHRLMTSADFADAVSRAEWLC